MDKKIQIYFVDVMPKLAAQALIDEHISSQIMNCVRILCNAHRILDGNKYVLYDEREPLFYKVKQIKNPWSKWCRETVQNYLWISDYLFHLLDEHKIRLNRKHRILDVGLPFLLQSPPHKLKEYEWTNPPLTIPDECLMKGPSFKVLSLPDIINFYRYFYALSIRHIKPYKVGTHGWLEIIKGND